MRGERDKQTTPMPFEQSQKLARQGEDDHGTDRPVAEGSDVEPVAKPAEPEPEPAPAIAAAPPRSSIAMRVLASLLVLALAFAIFATISWLARAV